MYLFFTFCRENHIHVRDDLVCPVLISSLQVREHVTQTLQCQAFACVSILQTICSVHYMRIFNTLQCVLHHIHMSEYSALCTVLIKYKHKITLHTDLVC